LQVTPVVASALVEGGRRYMCEQGRCLVQRRVWLGDESWREGLRLHMEVRHTPGLSLPVRGAGLRPVGSTQDSPFIIIITIIIVISGLWLGG
jgi:hypothetical protein